MNVFDFDNTLLRGDSTARFVAWCLLRRPALWAEAPALAVNGALFLLRLRPKQAFKERLFRALIRRIGDVDAAVAGFWVDNIGRLKAWYPPIHRPDDVVISASPDWLIAPACEKLGIARVMGSPVDRATGAFRGPNCHGAEKVRRFREVYADAAIDEFYSDSHSDDPLAALAGRAWMVKGERLLPWG